MHPTDKKVFRIEINTGNGSGFPFASGVVLSTGNVASAPGPNTSLLSEGGGGWPGDADLDAAVGINSNNATIIEFDFVPLSDEISFMKLIVCIFFHLMKSVAGN